MPRLSEVTIFTRRNPHAALARRVTRKTRIVGTTSEKAVIQLLLR
jgi:hypothetical protein